MRRRRYLSVAGATATLAGCAAVSDAFSDDGPADKGVGLRLIGLTAGGLTVGDPESLGGTVAEELDLFPADVRVRSGVGEVELFTDEPSQDAFVDALGSAGLDVTGDDVRTGVTDSTRTETVELLRSRLDREDYGNVTVEPTGDPSELPHVGFHAPDASERDVLEQVGNRGQVLLVAGYPRSAEGGTELVIEQLLSHEDFTAVGDTTVNRGIPRVPVRLGETAAERFVEVMTTGGFTDQGIGQCEFDPEEESAPNEGEWCIYTVLDGEYLYGASLGENIAQNINSGGFVADPWLVFQTVRRERAENLEQFLRTGPLPTDIEVVEN